MKNYCDMCKVENTTDDREAIEHLNIFAFGSEGVWLCVLCRILLGEIIRTLAGDSHRRKIRERTRK